MQIAIVGAGFCGLAVAWYLSKKEGVSVKVFDPLGIGQGASGVAAGLLHPYAGAHAKKSFKAESGIKETLELVAVAEKALGKTLILNRGIARLAITHMQKQHFQEAASIFSDVVWLNESESQLRLGNLHPFPGILINSGLTIDSANYLKGLWLACSLSGVKFEKNEVHSLSDLNTFDQVIVAAGAKSRLFSEFSNFKITPIKGQLLKFLWPLSHPPLIHPISSKGYLITLIHESSGIAGATYERNYISEAPDLHVALKEIVPKITPFFPEIQNILKIECHAGIRASTPDHLPIIRKVEKNKWCLTGMGSKGLLYHALYAKELVDQMFIDIYS